MKATQHIETLLIFKHFYTLRGSWRSAESKADLLFVRQQRTSTTFKRKGDLLNILIQSSLVFRPSFH